MALGLVRSGSGTHTREPALRLTSLERLPILAPQEWYVVQGADHNDVPSVGGRAYFTKLFEFISGVIGR